MRSETRGRLSHWWDTAQHGTFKNATIVLQNEMAMVGMSE